MYVIDRYKYNEDVFMNEWNESITLFTTYLMRKQASTDKMVRKKKPYDQRRGLPKTKQIFPNKVEVQVKKKENNTQPADQTEKLLPLTGN